MRYRNVSLLPIAVETLRVSKYSGADGRDVWSILINDVENFREEGVVYANRK